MTYSLLSRRKRVLCVVIMGTMMWNGFLGAIWLQLKGVWYSSPASHYRAPLRPHPVVLVSWSLDWLTVRIARFLLQEINLVKDNASWGRGKGKSYKIVLARSQKFFVKKKVYIPPAVRKYCWRAKSAPLWRRFSDSFIAEKNNLVI